MKTKEVMIVPEFPDRVWSLPGKETPFVFLQKVQGALQWIPDFQKTCKDILEATIEETEAENCSLMLKNPLTGDLIIYAGLGKGEAGTIYYPGGFPEGKRFKLGEGIAGWVLKEGFPIFLKDALKDHRFIKGNGQGKIIRSLICQPLRDGTQIVGVLNMSHSQREAFSEESEKISAFIAQLLGVAFSASRFFMEIQKKNLGFPESGEGSFHSISSFIPHPANGNPFEILMEDERDLRNEGIFLYASAKMQQIKAIIDRIANTDVTVLIQGESGTGKEVLARAIHVHSFRRDRPFIKVNCAALPPELLESELFGYERGAFTGAYRKKLGKFDLAHGGTIFLDEIADMNFALQGKLLHVLQDREFSRLGGTREVQVDSRVVVASNQNLEEAVRQGRFREDLYYRLNVVNILIPPLRERKEEIPIFVKYFLNKFSKKYQRQLPVLSQRIIKLFDQYHWPGNVRELENTIQRLVVLGGEKSIVEELISAFGEESPYKRDDAFSEKNWPSLREVHHQALVQAEKELIIEALQKTKWNRKKAAVLLNISYKALLYKIRECGLDKKISLLKSPPHPKG